MLLIFSLRGVHVIFDNWQSLSFNRLGLGYSQAAMIGLLAGLGTAAAYLGYIPLLKKFPLWRILLVCLAAAIAGIGVLFSDPPPPPLYYQAGLAVIPVFLNPLFTLVLLAAHAARRLDSISLMLIFLAGIAGNFLIGRVYFVYYRQPPWLLFSIVALAALGAGLFWNRQAFVSKAQTS
jgi:hypothetical protein